MRFVLILLLSIFLHLPSTASAQLPTPSAPAAKSQPPEPNVDDLVRILENDQARNALISRLKNQAAEKPAGEATEDGEATPTIARQIAEQTRSVAEQIMDAGKAVWAGAASIGAVIQGSGDFDLATAGTAALNVLLVGAGLFLSFFVFRIVVHFLQKRLDRRAAGQSWLIRTPLILISTLVDAIGVGLACGVGYLIALQVVGGTTGRMDIEQTLLLNAFLMVEIIKVGLRTLFQPRFTGLRPIVASDTSCAYWYFWLARAVSLTGYTFMFVAPVVAANVSAAAAQAVRLVVMLTLTIAGILIILQNKERVRAVLARRAHEGRTDVISRGGAALSGVWHLLAILYLVAVFSVWLVNPTEALPFMIRATLQSGLAIAVGGAIIAFVSRFVNIGVHLPKDLRERLPALEGRLEAFVPRMMQAVRAVVTVGVVLAIAEAWGLIDFFGWITSDNGQRVAGSVVSAVLVLLVGFIIYLAVSSWVEYRLNPNFGTVPTTRERTLLSLFRNAFTIALIVLVTMLALAQIGVNIAPLLAGAGVLGLAIGFGAQKLVQDIITGVFIQLENVMNEGDFVSIGGVGGTVERLTIRSVSIRDLHGTLHLIPFSSVETVANRNKGFGYHVAEIGVAYRENIDEVKDAMHEAFDLLAQTDWNEKIIGPLEMQGLTTFGDSAITVRARIKTIPGAHWAVGRAYNEFVKQVFDRRGIEMPFPHITLYMGEDKTGSAPPLNIRHLRDVKSVGDDEEPSGAQS
jgi:small conductance mechanosensitive channel